LEGIISQFEDDDAVYKFISFKLHSDFGGDMVTVDLYDDDDYKDNKNEIWVSIDDFLDMDISALINGTKMGLL